ncbi:MAG: 6,7-dimethyl-8-ribityllumazine synthase [Deltaproteobacteria bacterium]|nr:6,7-dimethyl-8-ribityllumazine synthase [Deltaproteobacteria bacterium]
MDAHGCRFGIVAARYYDEIVGNMVSGAIERLVEAGTRAEDITVAWCSGAVELPLLADTLACSCDDAGRSRFDAILAMGCVIRGGTPHFDYVCDMAAQGLMRVSLDRQVPVAFGVLTCDDGEQAKARSGLPTASGESKGNKGVEAAEAAIEMVNLVGPRGLVRSG